MLLTSVSRYVSSTFPRHCTPPRVGAPQNEHFFFGQKLPGVYLLPLILPPNIGLTVSAKGFYHQNKENCLLVNITRYVFLAAPLRLHVYRVEKRVSPSHALVNMALKHAV